MDVIGKKVDGPTDLPIDPDTWNGLAWGPRYLLVILPFLTEKQYSFGFALASTTDGISMRMITHNGLPIGKITIQNLVIAPLFPIKDNEDLSKK